MGILPLGQCRLSCLPAVHQEPVPQDHVQSDLQLTKGFSEKGVQEQSFVP